MKQAIVLLATVFLFSFCNTPSETTATNADSVGAAGTSQSSSGTGSQTDTSRSDTSGAKRDTTTRPQQ